MNTSRRFELETTDSTLTREEIDAGYHFCPDWDYMVVGPADDEKTGCFCKRKVVEPVQLDLKDVIEMNLQLRKELFISNYVKHRGLDRERVEKRMVAMPCLCDAHDEPSWAMVLKDSEAIYSHILTTLWIYRQKQFEAKMEGDNFGKST